MMKIAMGVIAKEQERMQVMMIRNPLRMVSMVMIQSLMMERILWRGPEIMLIRMVTQTVLTKQTYLVIS